jgi:membrane fusion protein, heavy metal efflux system
MSAERSITANSWRALCLLASLALAGCNREPGPRISDPSEPTVEGDRVVFPNDAPQLAAITVETAEPHKLAVSHASGRLTWNEEKTVRVFTPAGGRVKSVFADIGQDVSVGAKLAEIDSPDFGQALASARTAVGKFTAADRAFARTKDLAAHGAAASKDAEAAEADQRAAEAERDRALAQLANYGGDIASTKSLYLLRSPIAGVLVGKNLNPGQELRPDMIVANLPPLFVVSDPTTLWVQVDVAETDLPSLKVGLPLRITSKVFPDRTFEGTLEKIGDTLDPTTRTVKVRGIVGNPEKLLKAEMYVLADIVQDTSRSANAGVDVPSSSLLFRDNDYYVFTEESPSHFERRKVRVGEERDGTVPVLEGVATGQKVVSQGALLLQALLEPS